MRGRVLEARELTVLRDQVEDRVEDQVDERELAVDARRRHVSDHGLDPVGSGLLAQASQHGLRVVDADDAHPALGERQRDPARADRELQRGAVAGELRECLRSRPDHGRIEHAGRVLVVDRRDPLAEVPLVRSHCMPPPGIEPGTFGLRVRCSAS
jgi:hypothetical protein